MAQQDYEFSDRLADIYQDIEPSLLSAAHRFQAPNPRVIVKEWMSQAYVIASRFDNGELQLKVYSKEDSQDEMVPYDAEKHTRVMGDKSFKNYLKRCFTTRIFKDYGSEKRHRQLNQYAKVVSDFSVAGFASEEGASLLKYDVITISHIINLVSHDVTKPEEGSADLVQQRFVRAILRFCEALRDREGPGDWANLVVVTNIEEANNKKFFTYDFRSEIETGLRRELCKMVLEEDNLLVVKQLVTLARIENSATLRKRISRYFFKRKRGFPERLRIRVKNRTL